MCLGLIGIIIAIPTDYGRIFFVYSFGIVISLFLTLLVVYPYVWAIFFFKRSENKFNDFYEKVNLMQLENINSENIAIGSQNTQDIGIRTNNNTNKFIVVCILLVFLTSVVIYFYLDFKPSFFIEKITNDTVSNIQDTVITDNKQNALRNKTSEQYDDLDKKINKLINNLSFYEVVELINENIKLYSLDEQTMELEEYKKNALSNIALIEKSKQLLIYHNYEIQEGDTAYGIANKFNMSFSELQTKNKGSLENIKTGDMLLVKVKVNLVSVEVKKNETLSHISVKYGLSVEKIKGINNIKTDQVKAGQVIYVIENN
jgi:LysM repeat protein